MDNEIERRRTAAQFAIDSVRLSGFVLDAECRSQFERYIIGEITTEQMRENVLKRYVKTSATASN